jgi:hypothetical protein
MNKKSQKIAAIGIGFILSVLLIYIGFRIVQKRGSQAGVTENFKCVRSKDTESTCTWTSRTDEVGRILYASMPPGGLQDCSLVFIAEELGTPVALGDGNFEHTVVLQPLVSKQSYCAAPAGSEDNMIEVPASVDGASAGTTGGTGGQTVLDVTPSPTTGVVIEPTAAPTSPQALPSPQPSLGTTTDTEIDAYFKNASSTDDWGDCLDYFEKKGQQVSGNACIKGYYRHNVTPTPAS